MENQQVLESNKRGTLFIFAIIIMAVFSFMSIGIDVDEFKQSLELNIPQWYFYLIFGVDFLIIASLISIYFFRKVGVFIFPLAVSLHFIFHNYYLSTFLYMDVMNLFLYVAVGLLAFIPKWQFFK